METPKSLIQISGRYRMTIHKLLMIERKPLAFLHPIRPSAAGITKRVEFRFFMTRGSSPMLTGLRIYRGQSSSSATTGSSAR